MGAGTAAAAAAAPCSSCLEPALLPARLAEGAGASHPKVLVVSGIARSQAQRLYSFLFLQRAPV